MIGILEYGCGNLRSLENALEALGLEGRRVATPEAIDAADRLILPGVGHFGHAMSQLRNRDLESAVKAFAASGRPLLGICLGMQVLFEGSDEAPNVPGLGLLPGRFEPFTDPALKVPHMGWSSVDFADRALLPGLRPGNTWGSKGGHRERSEQAVPPLQNGTAYFVHSYFLPQWPDNTPRQCLGLARYGRPFVAAFRSGNLAGCQFHPEKSGPWGLVLLKEMTTW